MRQLLFLLGMLFSIISQAQDRTPDEIIAARYRVLATKQDREKKEKDLGRF